MACHGALDPVRIPGRLLPLFAQDLSDFLDKWLGTHIEGRPLMVLLWLDFENRGARFVNSVPAGLMAHHSHNGRFIHEAQFSLRAVLFGLRVIDNRRIHEHAATG